MNSQSCCVCRHFLLNRTQRARFPAVKTKVLKERVVVEGAPAWEEGELALSCPQQPAASGPPVRALSAKAYSLPT